MPLPCTPPKVRREKKARPFRNFLWGLLGGLILFLVLAIALAVVFPWAIPSPLKPGERSVTSDTIRNSFDSIAELSVEEYNFTNIGKFSEENKEFFGVGVPLTGKNALITYDGTVKAGIKDITAVEVDINDTLQTITVSLPKTEVLSSSIEPDSIQQYDQSNNILNQINAEDIAELLSTEEDNAEVIAVDNGLLGRAGTRSEDLFRKHVEALVEGTNMASYDVKIES